MDVSSVETEKNMVKKEWNKVKQTAVIQQRLNKLHTAGPIGVSITLTL